MRLRKWHLILLISFYFLVALLNLHKIPIAWIDEVMLIDPAHQYLQTGKFASRIWPHHGSEQTFLAYLPLSSYVQVLNLFLFPDTLFFTRISSWIALLICSFFLFRTWKERYHMSDIAVWILLVFFLFDEGIGNTLRSGRVEVLELALLSLSFYLFTIRKYPFIETLCLSLLLIAHPAVYPIALILFTEILFRRQRFYQRLLHVIILLIPLSSYLYLADFNFSAIYEQLVLHGREHDETAITGNIFYLHFVQRFLPVYIPQLYIIVLNVLIHLLCIYNIFTKKNFHKSIIEICFLTTSLFWIFKLAPFWRYSPLLVFMMFLLLPELYKRSLSVFGYLRLIRKTGPFHVWVLWIAILYVMTPFILRNYTAFVQRPQRDEFAVYQWLDHHITNEDKILIVDEAIGFYYAMNRKHTDFSLVFSVKKFQYKDYEKVYLLSYELMPPPYRLIDMYIPETPSCKISDYIPQKNIITYEGLKLYEVSSQEELQLLYK